jgi:hypothetical protein
MVDMSDDKYIPQYKKLGLTPIKLADEVPDEIVGMEMSPPINVEDILDESRQTYSADNYNDIDVSKHVSEDYLIMIDGGVFFLGSKDDAEEQILLLSMGEHPDYSGDVSQDRISVFKKMSLKIGISII